MPKPKSKGPTKKRKPGKKNPADGVSGVDKSGPEKWANGKKVVIPNFVQPQVEDDPPRIPLGPADAIGVFDAVFQAQWGYSKKNRDILIEGWLNQAALHPDIKERNEAAWIILEAQKLDIATAGIIVKNLAIALAKNEEQEQSKAEPLQLTHEQVEERLKKVVAQVGEEPIPVPIRMGQPQILADDDEYEAVG